MSRQVFVWLGTVLTVLDAAIHVRRSLLPDGNPFGTPLHQQFFLYSAVALILVVVVSMGPRLLGSRAWLASAALMVWELGAIGVWLVAYHAPNPSGLVPSEGYISKVIEALIVLALVPTLRLPSAASLGPASAADLRLR